MIRFLQFLLCIAIVWPLANDRKSAAAPNAAAVDDAPEANAPSPPPPRKSTHRPVAKLFRSQVPDDFAAMFRELSFRYTGRGYHGRLFRYRLFVPDISDPSKKFPLVIWLHGYDQGGDDNIDQLLHLDVFVFQKPWQKARFPFLMLAVQCPSDNRDWTTRDANADDMINVVNAALDKTIHDFPIDTARISVAGISSGGGGAWALGLRYADRFSALAPMSSVAPDATIAPTFKDIPVWTFVSGGDKNVEPDSARQMADAINAAGGHAALTVTETRGHDSWDTAFRDYDLLEWLLYQQRGKMSDYPPGTIPLGSRWRHIRDATISLVNPANWQPWQLLAQIGIPTILVLSYLSAKKHRRRRGEGAAADSSPKGHRATSS